MASERYVVRIIRRDMQGQIKDDFHATVTRKSDGKQLVFISDYRWVLQWKIRYGALKRAFRYSDKREKKMAEVEEFETG